MDVETNREEDNSELQAEESFTPSHEEITGFLGTVEQLAIFGFWEWDIQSGEVKWSDHLFSLFDRDKKTFKPSYENFLSIVHEKDKEHVTQNITESVEQKSTLDYEFTGLLPNGTERVYHTWGGIQVEKGNPIKVVGIVKDITDQVHKQRKIEDLNRQLDINIQELNESNELLRKKHDEKATLLKEIHHRIKNNLQIVNSLIRFQSSRLADSSMGGVFKDIENRIFAISSLHEKLYQSSDLKYINIHDHFSELIGELIKSNENHIKIRANITIEEIKIHADQLIPLGLILNEFVTNSIEHAFVGRKEGEIYFSISSNATKDVEIIFGDNGIGHQGETKLFRAGAVGIELVHIFANQLKGTLTRLDKPGTFHRLVFKLVDAD